jgi:photosystem II stability/assembly factor-like uncharacterized protein
MNIIPKRLITYLNRVNKAGFIILLFLFFPVGQTFAQWDKITNIPPQYQNSKGWLEFWFLDSDPNYGWVCGFNGMVLRTTDGGNSWQGTIVPNADQLESITFTDKYTGYVSGTSVYGYGAIYKSTDGGQTWREITDKRRVSQLWGNYFLDSNNGIIIGGGCDFAPLQFFRTTDGGNSWSLFQYPSMNSALSDVILRPDGTGYATSSGLIWITTDGGFTWRIFKRSGAFDWQEDLHIEGKTILVPYSAGCNGNLSDGGIRISTDFGQTWRQYHTRQPMFGAWLMDDMRGWACGHEAHLYYTSNGGATWELKNCGIDPDDVLDDFWFVNDTTGFVCGKNIYRYSIPKKIQAKIIASEVNACDWDTIILAADGKYFHYEWSNGSTDSLIKVTKGGTYELLAYNSVCDTALPAQITVRFDPRPTLELLVVGDTVICEGDSVLLIAKSDADIIQWSTGEYSDTIVVKKSGTYSIVARNEYGCESVEEISIRVVPLPDPKITLQGRSVFCIGDSTVIVATPGYTRYIWYDGNGNYWETASNVFRVGHSGKFYCIAVNEEGCTGGSKDSIEITVMNEINRLAFSFPEEYEFDMDSTYFPNMICKMMRIRNITKKEWMIDLPYLFQNVAFSFPLMQFPIYLRGGDSIDIKVCYSPTQLGVQRDTVKIEDICNPHYLILKGVSVPNSYVSNSICNVPVVGHTVELPDKYKFSTTEPYPNPAAQVVKVPFNSIAGADNTYNETATLYDIYGNVVAVGERKIIAVKKKDNMTVTIGEFKFDVNNVKPGAYLIVLRSEDDVIKYSLVVLH